MSMSVENRARIAFGLVILICAAAGLTWYRVAANRYTTFEVRTHDPVSGLMADAPVEFHGVAVGTVEQVKLVDPHSVRILLSIRRDAPVTKATVATITTRGLAARGFMGYAYIDLEDVGTDSGPLTPRYGSRFPVISAAPSRFLTVDTTADTAVQDVQVLTGLLQSVLDRNTVASLKESLDELQNLVRNLTAHSKKLDAIIENTQVASTNAAAASRQVRPLLESSQEAVEAMQTEVLPEADQTLVKLHQLSNSLDEITAEIERDPSVILRGKKPPPPGPGEKK